MSDTDRGERTVVYFRTYLQVAEAKDFYATFEWVTHNATGSLHVPLLGPARRPRASPRRDVPFPLRGAGPGSLNSYVLLFTSCYLVWCVPSTPRARAHALGLTDCLTTRQDPHTRCTRTQTCTSACCRAAVLLPAAVHAPKSPAPQKCNTLSSLVSSSVPWSQSRGCLHALLSL
jgi:hypothetical protein